MSKPKSNPSGSYAGFVTARFQCPEGHDVGAAVLVSDGAARHIVGAQWLVTPDGGKLRMTCKRCLARGRRLDLQANWGRVMGACLAVEADPDKATVTLPVGGRAH